VQSQHQEWQQQQQQNQQQEQELKQFILQVECLKVRGEVLRIAADVPWQSIVQVTVPPSNKVEATSSKQPCIVQFGYSEDMNTVLAECTTHKGLLDLIEDNDDGLSWPHCVHDFAETPPLPPKGRPYRWCQHLGGLDLYLLPSSVAETVDGSGGHTFSTTMFIRRVKRLLATNHLGAEDK
jgi:hypothetical protein